MQTRTCAATTMIIILISVYSLISSFVKQNCYCKITKLDLYICIYVAKLYYIWKYSPVLLKWLEEQQNTYIQQNKVSPFAKPVVVVSLQGFLPILQHLCPSIY